MGNPWQATSATTRLTQLVSRHYGSLGDSIRRSYVSHSLFAHGLMLLIWAVGPYLSFAPFLWNSIGIPNHQFTSLQSWQQLCCWQCCLTQREMIKTDQTITQYAYFPIQQQFRNYLNNLATMIEGKAREAGIGRNRECQTTDSSSFVKSCGIFYLPQ